MLAKRFSRVARCGAASLLLRIVEEPLFAQEPRRPLAFHDHQFISCIRQSAEAKHFYGRRRTGLFNRLSGVADKLFDFSPVITADERIAYAQRPHAHNDGRGGSSTLLELGFNDRASWRRPRIRFQLEDLRLQADHLEQIVDAGPLGGANGTANDVASPILRRQTPLLELRLSLIDIGCRQIDLIDRDHQLNLGRLGMVDGLNRLRHQAVVSSHHEHNDIGDVRAAGSHSGKSGMARRVEESNSLPIASDTVCADVLRDATCFACRYPGLANRIEKRGFAVIDVAHESHDGCTRLEGLLARLLRFLRDLNLHFLLVMTLGSILLLALKDETVLLAELRDGIELQRLVDVGKYLKRHQVGDNLKGFNANQGGQVLDGN